MSERDRYRPTTRDFAVLIGVAAILFTLVAVGVQRAREAARRTRCANNLKMLGLACHNYLDVHKRLPSGTLGPIDSELQDSSQLWNEPWCSLTVYLHPYLEASPLFDQLSITIKQPSQNDVGGTVGGEPVPYLSSWSYHHPPWWTQDAVRSAACSRLPYLLCPSTDAYANHEGTSIFLFPHHNGDPQPGSRFLDGKLLLGYLSADTELGQALGRTNYLGACGVNSNLPEPNSCAPYDGIFGNRNRESEQAVLDGMSNTVMLGESIGGWSQPAGRNSARRNFSHSWIGSGIMPAKWGLRNFPTRGDFDAPYYQNWYQFSSEHSRTVQFTMGDASVRVINDSIELWTWYASTGRREATILATQDSSAALNGTTPSSEASSLSSPSISTSSNDSDQ